MGWQDAPIVSKGGGGWQDAPLVGEAAPANPPEIPTNTPKGFLGRVADDLRERSGKVQANLVRQGSGEITGSPALDIALHFPGIAVAQAGQAAGAIGDVAVEGLKSGYNALVPEAAKELLVRQPIRYWGSTAGGKLLGKGARTVAATAEEFQKAYPDAALALEAAVNLPAAAQVLKGTGAVVGELGAIGKDATAAAVPKSVLVNAAQSSLKLPTAIKPAKQLAMGEDLLAANLGPTDYVKLAERSKELSAAVRDKIAPVAKEPLDTTKISPDLLALDELKPFKIAPQSAAMQGLTGKPVERLSMTIGDAQELKQSIDKSLVTHYTKEMKGLPTAWSDVDVKKAKELRNVLQKEIEAKVPEVTALNAENSKLLRLKPAVDKAANVAMDARVIEHPLKMAANRLRNADVAVARKLYAAQQAGPESATGKFLNKLAR